MKYLVMECHPGYAVVLSEDGRFLRAANMRYEVGQTVTEIMELNLPEQYEMPEKKHSRRWISVLAAAVACLILAVTSVFFSAQLPYASVYMTINPEVRIDVNRKDTVVDVEGINADGSDLLEGYDYSRKDLDTVMDELVDLAIERGYLHEGGKITLTLDGNESWISTHETEISAHLNDHLTEKISVTIDVERPKEQQPPQSTSGGQSVVIPVGPESDYSDSAYGSDPGEEDRNAADGSSDYRNDDSDDGQTDYGTSGDDGQSDYDHSDDADLTDDGDSGYEETVVSNQSDYAAEATDGQSGYGDSAYEADSNYESDE